MLIPNKLQIERLAFLMRSSPGTLQNHYLKKDVDLMQDEDPEPQQQQKILTEINKNVVETQHHQKLKMILLMKTH